MKGFSDTGGSDPVRRHLDEAFSVAVQEPPRRRALRCSGLPYCPILDVLLPDEAEPMDLEGTLFTSMGTAAHASLQLFMTLGKHGARVWGSWLCTQCNKKLKYQFRPPDCCGVPMRYDEVDVRVGPMTGHMDLVACYKRAGRRTFWVIYEFKTIGAKPKKPKRVHQLQVRHYVAMLKMCHNIDVDAYAVVYVGRQFLERWPFGPYDARGSVRETRNWMFRAISGYKAATKARKDPSRANLKEVVLARPCTSKETWHDYMSRSYSFKDGSICPMLGACSSGNGACLRAVESTIRGE